MAATMTHKFGPLPTPSLHQRSLYPSTFAFKSSPSPSLSKLSDYPALCVKMDQIPPLTQPESFHLLEKTPPRIQPRQMNSPISNNASDKLSIPSSLTVPKAFKFLEMYTSPTDLIMSPVSRGLLARTKSKSKSKKFSVFLPPSTVGTEQHKVQASKFQDMGALEI